MSDVTRDYKPDDPRSPYHDRSPAAAVPAPPLASECSPYWADSPVAMPAPSIESVEVNTWFVTWRTEGNLDWRTDRVESPSGQAAVILVTNHVMNHYGSRVDIAGAVQGGVI